MKAAIYNPYLDTLGGGEYYTVSFAKVLRDEGYEVDIQWQDPKICKLLEDRFGVDLHAIRIVKDIKRGDGYDICFWVSDGSIPTLFSRKNYLHFQYPFKDVGGRSLLNKMKLFRINKIICNSYFTKKNIDEEYGVDSTVIYPPVATDKISPRKKENIILYVGRFSQLTQAKHQDVLIKAFKKLHNRGARGWRLILAGGAEVGSTKYFKRLTKMARSVPVELVASPSYAQLLSFYGRSKIFWSASGFGIDEKEQPIKVEHFGITVVEAMAAGAVPLVYDAGGHKEIVDDGQTGYLWKTSMQLVKHTHELIANRDLLTTLSNKCVVESKIYEYDRFYAEVADIIKN